MKGRHPKTFTNPAIENSEPNFRNVESGHLSRRVPSVGFHPLEITIALRFDLSIKIGAQQCVPLDFEPSLNRIDEPG
jgi:hypothetical protein